MHSISSKRSLQLNQYVTFHYYYCVMLLHTTYIASFNERNVLDDNEKKLVTYYLRYFFRFLCLDKSYICSSRNDQMSMPYKHQLLIEELENVITIIPWSSLMYSVLCKVDEHAFIFKK